MRRWKAHRGKVASLSFSRDGRLLASCTGSGRDIFIWNALSGELVRKLTVADEEGKPDNRQVQGIAFAPDADLLAVGRYLWVEMWDAWGWQRAAEVSGDYSNEVAVGPGDPPLLVASSPREVAVWQFRATDDTRLVPVTRWRVGNLSQVSFSHDGLRVATHTTRQVEVRDLPNGGDRAVFINHQTNYSGPVRFSPDSTRLAFCYTKTIESHPATLDDPIDVIRYAGHTNKVWALRYTPDGRSLISASADGTVRVWEAATGLQKQSFEMNVGKMLCADVSPDGTMAAVGGANGEIVVWDLE